MVRTLLRRRGVDGLLLAVLLPLWLTSTVLAIRGRSTAIDVYLVA
jgi:hypothetical protein